ncbi:ribonuclease H-like domain-containing protein [Talaromyces proteolyticus]|uniref:Ribonuclease H-like domain-containing protein n=1 Tax=Talaromyces proteolyticus TaxID=1131652 RepID=A0AAD4KH29_9EURO|nr:ribonuclease H-like domain-containing protein [Talaromyces proteolyticus]KAH8691555.1 ribonuclease H-like domain-containing protein [Talaromyces proteolyticus]
MKLRQDNKDYPNPNPEVERIENKSAVEAKTKKRSETNPQRPGYGVAGKKVVLWANYFNLHSKKDVEFYRYSVTIAADSRGRVPVGKKVKRIIQLLLEDHLFGSYGSNIATDFKSNLICRVELDLDEEDEGQGNNEFVVTYRSEEEDVPAQNAIQYRCRIQFTGSLTLSELVNYLTSTQAGLMFGSKEEIIQALNIVLGYYPKADDSTITVASNRHFDTKATDRMSLGAGLQVIRGFFMSVRTATARVLVNVQVKNMAFYENGPLDRLMGAFMAGNRGANKVDLLKFVKGLTIDRTHLVNKNSTGKRIPKLKKVEGFATKDDGRRLAHPPIVPQFGAGAKEVQFYLEDSPVDSSSKPGPAAGGGGKKGKKGVKKAGPDPPPRGRYISVFDFFKEKYNTTIKDPSLPVINVNGKDNPSYLPAEVCEVPPGQPARAKLSSAQTQQMIRFAVRRPVHNAKSIVTSGGKLLGFEPTNATLDAFNITVPPKLITVPGRVLNAPAVKYSTPGVVMPRFGGWDMRSVKFATKADLPSWTYLRISLQGGRSAWPSEADFIAKMDELQAKLRELGISVNNYLAGGHLNASGQQVENGIDQWIHRFAVSPRRPKLILVIIPDAAMTVVYNRIKYMCDVKEGILNVCVVDSKFSRANPQYLANVGLKFNLKLGGRNQALDPPKLGFIGQKRTMVVGIDGTHPSPGSSTKAPSVAAIVASVDEWLSQWPADIRVQPARQEMVADLETMFKSRLLLWRERNKTLPDNILVYRDGVSEGQYDIVINEELPALRAACKTLYPVSATKSDKPHITIIIVGKRHNTRFYPTKKEDADRGGNPMNGTVVDRGVTEARNWDFFLQAHTAIQGTARPAHYYVVYDQIFRDLKSTQFATAADALEDLTHNLCYLFGRATKAVSICPPAYYADLVCTRARCYLSGLFDPSSSSSPDTSSVGTAAATGPAVPDASLVTIHSNVRNAMFYV